MRTFGATGARVSVIPALLQIVGSAVEFDDVHGVAVLGVRSFSLPRSSRVVKRMFDVRAHRSGWPSWRRCMALTAVLVKLTSRGPMFFRQERMGRGGPDVRASQVPLDVIDAEERKGELVGENQAAEGFFKIADDPRITRMGRVLRRTNLDELPQLLNVLRGEMSLVGPRPLIPQEDRRVVGWHRRRLELTPGMTGHWQVLGSSRVPLDEMVAIDYLYVANWSLWTDLKLLLRTIPHVVRARAVGVSRCGVLKACERRTAVRNPARPVGQVAVLDDPVDESVGDRLRAGEVAVALHVGVHPLELLAGVLGIDLVDARAQRQHLPGVDLDVARLALEPAGGLVDQDPAVRAASGACRARLRRAAASPSTSRSRSRSSARRGG